MILDQFINVKYPQTKSNPIKYMFLRIFLRITAAHYAGAIIFYKNTVKSANPCKTEKQNGSPYRNYKCILGCFRYLTSIWYCVHLV